MANILLLNGPNLNRLGTREPDIYGAVTLAELETDMHQRASDLGHRLESFQSNAEHEIIDKIHASFQKIDMILFNPAAFTHTSVAIRDALASVDIPFYEIHISNVHAREAFRHHSFFSDMAQGVICGFGLAGYGFALHAADRYLTEQQTQQQT
ncbi:MAG: type II 3-dehydroquinate dehydratase [Gammaproteobacteria bacterium]|nr:type II 3-dehydroquinate dehydratase [Gammaproteobacteria bacterium]